VKNKHINGQLKLSFAAMNDRFSDQYAVHAAIEEHQLGRIMYIDNQWYHGIIPVKALYGTPEEADVESIMTADVIQVSEALKEFLQSEKISKLGLSGEIIMKTEDTKADKASMARITVKDGQVSYQRTSYVWSENVAV
jgi:hypothetical protein